MASPSGTVAMSSSPSKESARPKRPELERVAPPSVPSLPPLSSTMADPAASSKPKDATGCEAPPPTVWLPRTVALVPPLPSSAVTSTATTSPASPFPGSARLSVRPLAPLMAVPLRNHWYW